MSTTVSNVNSNKMAAKKSAAVTTQNVTAATPVVAATKTRKAPAKAEVTVPVVGTSTVETPVAVATVTETRSAGLILADLQDHLRALGSEMSSRIRGLVAEAIETTKAIKRDARDSKRRRRKDPADMTPEERTTWEARRANNAFLKMRPLTDELSSFMGLPAKSQRSQTDVTKFVSTYVKTHNCFDPSFKRRIIPDAKLGKLLRVKDGQEVTYLNLQSFLKVHFIKPVVPTA
jgi:hypothetical protein